jgi:lysophospholipase L1-like esterase
VQADMLTHRVRQNIDSVDYSKYNPRGFIFPFTIAKTNNPSNYKISYRGNWSATRNVQKELAVPLGVSGIAVYTNDPLAEISVNLNTGDNPKRWSFDKLQLLGYNLDKSNNVKPVLKLYDNTKIEGIYDSISRSYTYFLPEEDDAFTIAFEQTDSTANHTFVVNGFLPDRDTTGIVYHSIGVNGASVPSYLKSTYLEDELRLIKPDLVIFAIGINDAVADSFTAASFFNNYNMLIERIEAVVPGCAYIFITNNDSYRKVARNRYEVNRKGLIAQSTFYTLAEQHQGGVWDLFAIMGGLRSMYKWQQAGLAQRDKIHFTKNGYVLIGDMFFNALLDYYSTDY